jgi:hypothetical protein
VSQTITLQPKQWEFDRLIEDSPASWDGFGGSRGCAKSGGLRRIMVRRRIQYPGTGGQIIRRVWDDVLKNHLEKMWEEFPKLYPYYKSSEHVIEMPNKSRIFFDAAENATDVQRKAFGPEFMDIFIDQAEQFSEQELTQIKTTCRWPGMPLHKCKFGLFFNPGGQGAGFLQRIFSTKEYHEREDPKDYAFVQAYGWDNVQWCLAALKQDYPGLTEAERIELFYLKDNNWRFKYYTERSQYGREMNALPAHMRAGQLLGDFKKFAGQYFSNFDEAVHVWDPNEIVFQPYWPYWISIDWGFQHHTSVHRHCQAGTQDVDGNTKRLVITHRELIKDHLSERALAEEIVAWNEKQPISNIFAGHDLWKEDRPGQTKEQAMSEVFRRHGLPSIKRAVIDRVDGWRFMHRALDEGEWIITRNCKEAISALPTRIFDEKKNNEDILKTNDLADDVADELRYGLYSQYAPSDLPDDVVVRQKVAHLQDPTNRNIQIMKLESDRIANLRDRGRVNSRSMSRYDRYALKHRR